MIKRMGIALATLFAVFTLASTPASATLTPTSDDVSIMTPAVVHVWEGTDYTGMNLDLGPTAICTPIPLATGADSAVQGTDNTRITTFYEEAPGTVNCTNVIDTMTGTYISDIGGPTAKATHYIMV